MVREVDGIMQFRGCCREEDFGKVVGSICMMYGVEAAVMFEHCVVVSHVDFVLYSLQNTIYFT